MDNNSGFVIDLVENCAKSYPSNVAIIDADYENGKSITYNEMWGRVCTLSSIIRQYLSCGIINISDEMTPLISIMMNRGIGSIICILAVLKAGAAYVPVDPSFPADRQEYIFTHSKSQLLLVDETNFPAVQRMGPLPPVIIIDAKTGHTSSTANQNNQLSWDSIEIAQRLSSELALAYVLYTSGSTGKPKGVMIQNKGLSNIVEFFASEFKVTPADRVLGLTTLCFDISMLELFLPLITGASLVVVSARTQKNPYRILDVIRDHRLTIVQATPTTYEMLIACDWNGDPNIHFLVGGEAIRPKVSQLALNSRSLTNVYGPTETTIWSSSYRLPNTKETLDKLVSIPIGAPISATYFYIVDDNMKLLPDGQEGELLIGGDGVALGYIHAPDLTEKRFYKNPYGDPGMVYRTGDLASKLPDGTYAFARRLDDQVKVNGYRIELGEVEVTMSKHPQVAQAVVIVKDDSLVGYVLLKRGNFKSNSSSKRGVLRGGASGLEENSAKSTLLDEELSTEIKKLVGDSLPKYMIPKFIIAIDEIPKTANGKLDRLTLTKLPLPLSTVEMNAIATQVTVAIDIDTSDHDVSHGQQIDHSMLGFVLQKVLDVSGRKPSPNASFAAVGVDSLVAVMFLVQLSKGLGGVSIDQNKLYDINATIGAFSTDLFDKMRKEKPEILDTLKIYYAMDDNAEYGLTDSSNNKNSNKFTLNSILLWNRKLFDGLRGMLIIFVLRDHFFNQAYQIRIGADTFMFIVITGLVTTLQSIAYAEANATAESEKKAARIASNDNDKNVTAPAESSWSALHFLTIRAVAIFPMYWLAILLCVPRIYVNVPFYGLTETQFGGLMTLYVFALENWTCWSHQVIADLYYVSFIWGIFLIYAIYMTVYYSKYLNWYFKWAGLGLTTGWVIGMYFFTSIYKPPDGSCIIPRSPASGFIYFVIGTIVSYFLNYLRLNWIYFQSSDNISNIYKAKSTSNIVKPIDATGDNRNIVNTLFSAKSVTTTISASSSTKGSTRDGSFNSPKSLSGDNRNTKSASGLLQNGVSAAFSFIHSRWITATAGLKYAYVTKFGCSDMYWALSVDILAFLFLFLMFFHFEKYDMPPDMYSEFDSIMRKWGFPVYFSLLLVVILLHSHADSLFTFVMKESYVFKLLGECSLPIYLFNTVIVKYIVPKAIFSAETNLNQFTRENDWAYGIPDLYKTPEYRCLGVVITLIFSIFIQKIFQDKLVMSVYIWSVNKWKTYSEHRNTGNRGDTVRLD